MKRILLASASIVAFAGAASAEVTFGGDATLGYNDTVAAIDDNNDGFYWESNLALGLSAELDNGLTAGVTFDIDINDDDAAEAGEGLGGNLSAGGFVLSLVSDEAGIYFGDTQYAAEKNWVNVDEMAADGFSEQDGETVLRGDVTFSGINASLSYNIADGLGNDAPDDLDQLSVGGTATFGAFAFSVAYQEESEAAGDSNPPATSVDDYQAVNDFTTDEILGVSASSTFVGADTLFAYAENMTQNQQSIGIAVSYPIGPVSLIAYYVMEDGDLEDEDAWGIGADYAGNNFTVEARYKETGGDVDSRLEATYALGNGLVFIAGTDEGGDDYYGGAKFDMGGGANLLATYAVDESEDSADEIGNGDYQEGMTVELTLAF